MKKIIGGKRLLGSKHFFVLVFISLLFVSGATLQVYSEHIVYKYDSLNRLIEVDYPDKIVTYTYDPAGNRISTQVQYLVAVPNATSLNRTTAVAGGTGFTLIIDGIGFDANSIVQVNGSNRTTTFISNTQLSVQILNTDVASAGTLNLTVLNQANGAVSNSQFLTIYSPPPGQTFGISGQVVYANGVTIVKGVTVNLTGSHSGSTTTDVNGNYSFPGLAPGGAYTVSLSKTGDVNGITAFDASLAARFPLSLVSLTSNQQIAADASNNGTVTAFDASEIARTALGIANPGIAGTWKFLQPSLSFGNLSSDQTGQNITGILVGDVSGNWTPPAGPAMAQPSSVNATITVGLPNKQDPPGGPSTIPIIVGDTTGQGVFAYDFDMFFDPAVLQLQSPAFDATGTLSAGWNINTTTSTDVNGKLHLLLNAFNTSAMSGQGTLIKLKFNVVGAQGSQTPLTWASFNFNEGGPTDPVDIDINGQFTATGPSAANGAISGHVATGNGSALEGVAVRLNGAQTRETITDANGNYNFENVETNGFYTVTPARVNYSFSPSQRSFSQLGQQTEAVFTASTNGSSLNPLETTEYFVRQQYVDFLNREPDEAGYNFWVNNIRSCGMDTQCVEAKRIQTSAAFFLSIEYQETGYLVYRMYQTAYGVMPGAPVPLQLNEFKPDTQQIGQGIVVNRGHWQEQLETNKQNFIAEFVERSRFLSAFPASMTPAQFVDKLNANAGNPLSPAERDQLVNDLSTNVKTRAQVLRTVAEHHNLVDRAVASFFFFSFFFFFVSPPHTPTAPPPRGGFFFVFFFYFNFFQPSLGGGGWGVFFFGFVLAGVWAWARGGRGGGGGRRFFRSDFSLQNIIRQFAEFDYAILCPEAINVVLLVVGNEGDVAALLGVY